MPRNLTRAVFAYLGVVYSWEVRLPEKWLVPKMSTGTHFSDNPVYQDHRPSLLAIVGLVLDDPSLAGVEKPRHYDSDVECIRRCFGDHFPKEEI